MISSNKNNKKIVANNPKPITLHELLSFDNIWKLAILGFMIASLYLQNTFITRTEFQKSQDQIQKIELILGQLEIKNQIDNTQNKTLDLIEIRLREIERSVAVLSNKT
jgi:hypothetical protein